MSGKDNSDRLWQIFSKMIFYNANYPKLKQKMQVEKVIEKGRDYDETTDYVEKARTLGVKI